MNTAVITARPYGGKHPVQVRLSEEEMLALRRRADAECRSLGSMASLLLRNAMGIESAQQGKQQHSTSVVAG